MSLLTWVRGVTGAGPAAAAERARPAEGPLPPHLAQEQRIWRKAARYREQFRAEAAARAAREVEQERARLERAREEHEDAVAFGLAMGTGAFPGDREGGLREPGPQIVPLQDRDPEDGRFFGFIRW